MSGQHSLKEWESQTVDGLFPLGEYLGGDETGAVFATEFEGQPAAIKVVETDGRVAEQLLWNWRLASKVSHPHLLRLWKVGRCQIDSASVAYIVMERADENLSQVLSERPLTPVEAKEMLAPALDALACIHREGFVHGRLTPANIMAVNDCVKLSSDHLRRAGELDEAPPLQGAFRAPEVAAGGKLSPAADIWALGVTLVEALTQRRPAWTGAENELVIPQGVAEPFLTIVRNCLRSQAQDRWTADAIIAHLNAPAAAPKRSSPWLYAIPAVVVLAVLAVWLGLSSTDPIRPSVTSSRPVSSPPVSTPTAQASSQPAPAPPAREPSPAPPTLVQPSPASKEPPAAEPVVPTPPPADSKPALEPVAESPSTSPDVVSQTMPEVLDKARRSIQGKVNVVLKVHADAYGAVRDVTLEPPPVSRYFSGVAMKAVRRWKFRTVKDGEVYTPQDWMVRFEFTRSDTKVLVEHAAP